MSDFGPSVFDVPTDFMHAIVTWIDNNPKAVDKRQAEEKKRRKEKAKAAQETEKKSWLRDRKSVV